MARRDVGAVRGGRVSLSVSGAQRQDPYPVHDGQAMTTSTIRLPVEQYVKLHAVRVVEDQPIEDIITQALAYYFDPTHNEARP